MRMQRSDCEVLLTVGKSNVELEDPALPDGLVLAGNAALPVLQVQDALLCARGLGEEAEWVVAPPLLPVQVRCCTSTVLRRCGASRTSPPAIGSDTAPCRVDEVASI
jgi:hypothetical protein